MVFVKQKMLFREGILPVRASMTDACDPESDALIAHKYRTYLVLITH